MKFVWENGCITVHDHNGVIPYVLKAEITAGNKIVLTRATSSSHDETTVYTQEGYLTNE